VPFSDNLGNPMRMDLSRMPHSACPEGHSSDTERHRLPILPSEDVIKPSHKSDAVPSGLSPEKQFLLKKRLAATEKKSTAEGLVTPRRQNRDFAPLSFSQLQMWVIDRMTPGNPAYNLPVGYRLRGPLNPAALEDSFNEVIRRHEILRTTFTVENDEPLQCIQPECKIRINFAELDPAAAESRLQLLAAEEALKSFDLSRLPLIRVSLFRLGEAEHVLIINLHHIVVDGISIGLILDEVDIFYRALTSGRDPHPPDLSLQYADFALWQRQAVDDAAYADQLRFWRKQLSGELPALELPADFPRPLLQSFKGSNVFLNLPQTLVRSLTSLGAREGCTFFMTVLAAFQVLLHRYSGAEEIVIGTPVALRDPGKVGFLIGNCLNMAALRCDLSGNPDFIEMLRRSRNTALNAFSNADLPFEALMKHLKIERNPGRNPVFQVMLQVLPASAPTIGELEISNFHFDMKFAQFDLALHFYEESGGQHVRFEYCTDVFRAETVERLSSGFTRLLQAVVTNPQQKVSELPILSESEKHQVLRAWNNTSKDYPRQQCLHNLFERTAKRAPNRVAVECAGQSLTYGELNAKANRLANHLRKSGVQPESCVGICLERSLELIVGLLAILKAGAAYVPMDPSFPPERLAWMMEDAGIFLLVTNTRLRKDLSRPELKAVCLDAEWEAIEQGVSDDPGVFPPPSSLAYVIYTSGSTGKPKGVMIEHRSLVNFLLSMLEEPGFDENDVLVAVTTISFDIAALEVFLPLISGGRLVVASKNEVVDGAALLERIASSGATVLQATPATWKLMLEAGWERTPGLKMLCGGESLPRELANRMHQRGAELWNMYGPTETTIWSSVDRVQPGSDPVLIGRPIANTQLYIVDKQMEPVPRGVVGELLIAGDGLSRGYRNRPDLTAERFIETSFLDPGNRAYRTGDLARFHPDGRVELLGRLDHQVKVRGYRIELGEIEKVLSQHQAIKDAVVVTQEDQGGDKRLVAYYIPVAGGRVKSGDLGKFLHRMLPDYMIPGCFVEMEAFLLTPNGKIDRKAFPKPESIALEAGSPFVEPEGELELRLADIWKKALRKQNIGALDNFFDLGGHSLLAAQVFAQMERQIGVKLPLALLFQAPTIRQLADLLRRENWTPSWSCLVPIRPGGSKPPLFLMHAHGGNVLEYYPLANLLGPDQPVYAFQARGLDGHIVKDSKLEDMAAAYITELRTLQPEGPYFLGGFCFGGLLALEVAQQLTAAGQEVALLVLIQTMHPEAMRFKPGTTIFRRAWYQATKRISLEVDNLSHRSKGYIANRLRYLHGVICARMAIAVDSLTGREHQDPSRPPMQYILETLAKVHGKAIEKWVPRPYQGRVVLFRASKQLSGLVADQYLGWKKVFNGNLEVREIPGHQQNLLLEPNVLRLATEFTNFLPK
jgi:amino acid adenylation domain-containing protein